MTSMCLILAEFLMIFSFNRPLNHIFLKKL